VALAIQHTHLAATHHAAQPTHILDGHAAILGTMMDDDSARNVYVAKADGLCALKTHEQVDGWVGIGGRGGPDG
jgi:hypothetical protein